MIGCIGNVTAFPHAAEEEQVFKSEELYIGSFLKNNSKKKNRRSFWSSSEGVAVDVYSGFEDGTIVRPARRVDARVSSTDLRAATSLGLLRTQGSWYLSARRAYVLGDYAKTDEDPDFGAVAAACDFAFQRLLDDDLSVASLGKAASRGALVTAVFPATKLPGLKKARDRADYVRAVVDGFFDNDLLSATRTFLSKNPPGPISFAATHTLDSNKRVVLATRGVPLSLAFYPSKNLAAFSHDASVLRIHHEIPEEKKPPPLPKKKKKKKALLRPRSSQKWATREAPPIDTRFDEESISISMESTSTLEDDDDDVSDVRLDLDDVLGEIAVLEVQPDDDDYISFCDDVEDTKVVEETFGKIKLKLRRASLESAEKTVLHRRLIALNEEDEKDEDLGTIPAAVARVRDDWRSGAMNRLTFWNLKRCLKKRLKKKKKRPLKGVDVIVTGRGIAFALGSQFAADLALVLPNAEIRAVSEVKLLAQLTAFATPHPGHFDGAWDLDGTIVLVLDAFEDDDSTLAQLLPPTCHIFAVAPLMHTRLTRSLQSDLPRDPRVFIATTNRTQRPSLHRSVATTHQLLTQILLQIAHDLVVHHDDVRRSSGSPATLEALEELDRCANDGITALEAIVGRRRTGKDCARESVAYQQLKAVGEKWGEPDVVAVKQQGHHHNVVLFVGRCIVVLLLAGVFFVSGMLLASFSSWTNLKQVACILIVLVVLLAVVVAGWVVPVVNSRKPRPATISQKVLILDTPWVASTARALAALQPPIEVAIGDPRDPDEVSLVPNLVAVGRPDGRLMALAQAEVAVADAVDKLQIDNDSLLTVGHNPLTNHNHVAIDGFRPSYLCERLLSVAVALEGTAQQNQQGFPLTSFSPTSDHSEQDDDDVLFSDDDNNEEHPLTATEMLETYKAIAKRCGGLVGGLVTSQEGDRAEKLRRAFGTMDTRRTAMLGFDEVFEAYKLLGGRLSEASFFEECENKSTGAAGNLTVEDFKALALLDDAPHLAKETTFDLAKPDPSPETHFFGERLLARLDKGEENTHYRVARSQKLSMLLYESRIASFHRLVAFLVVFHHMAKTTTTTTTTKKKATDKPLAPVTPTELWEDAHFRETRRHCRRVFRDIVVAVRAWKRATIFEDPDADAALTQKVIDCLIDAPRRNPSGRLSPKRTATSDPRGVRTPYTAEDPDFFVFSAPAPT